MQYTRITLSNVNEDQQDILVAQLSELGFEGFEHHPDQLMAYINEEEFSDAALKEITGEMPFVTETIAQQNWNAVWESNFEPVIVDGFCVIRADFHTVDVQTPYEIIITPKMSFGTGHHATTQLVMMLMKELDFTGKQVFDFGTGTGVLAILAEKLGADYILGADNDEWAVNNALENTDRNACSKITIIQNLTEQLPSVSSDITLANINRHVLLRYMSELYENLNENGHLVLSGILVEDREIITKSAIEAGFTEIAARDLNNWMAMVFKKN